MQLVAPPLLEPILGLSLGACAAGLILGLLLLVFGWLAHRFWIVLFATVAAGLVGLSPIAKVSGATPLVAGVLLAISAGMMALALARIMAFVAGGAAVCLALQLIVPAVTDRFLYFVVGGLAGLLMFRLWMMVLTSLAGTLTMTYSALCLLDQLGKLDAMAWATERGNMLNYLCLGGTVVGLIAQFLLERFRKKLKKQREEQAQLHRAEMELEKRKKGKTWWPFGGKSQAA
jgi:MFS family permease